MTSNIGLYDVTMVTLGAVAFWSFTGYVITSIIMSACFYFAGMLLGEWIVDRITR
jgi:hypothetical protein